MPIYGQVIIGPPGSGKTTYCNEMSKYLREMGRRVAIINIGLLFVKRNVIYVVYCRFIYI